MNTKLEQKLLLCEVTLSATFISPDSMAECGFPPNNIIGGILLTAYIELFLRAEGLADCEIKGVGELNRSGFCISTRNRLEALAALRNALAQIKLLSLTRVYEYDTDELVLRCLIPDGGASVSERFFPEEFLRRIQESDEIAKKAKARLAEIESRLSESGQ
jgi:hypothetical protein